MPAPPTFPEKSLYLIYGNDETAVNDTRYALVNHLLTPEERDSGLAEVRSAGNQPLTLDASMSQIVEELGTSSFLDDSRRVVVIYDLKDLYEAKRSRGGAAKGAKAPKKESSRLDIFLGWMRETLPTTRNIAVFVCAENEERQKKVSQDSPLYQFLTQHGHVIEKREKPLQYEFEELVLSMNGPAAIVLLREWIRRSGGDSGGRLRIYNTLAHLVELAMQARCQAEGRARRIPEGEVTVAAFPSLAKVPDWKARKIRQFAERLTMDQWRAIVREVHRLQTLMYPTGEEDYVPNWEDFMETLVMRLIMVRG